MSFLTTPSTARSRIVIGVLIAGGLLLQPVDSGVPVLLWTVLLAGFGLLMLHPDHEDGAVNAVSVLAGRPIALTARARERMTLHHIIPEQRRLIRMAGLVPLAFIVVAIVLGVADSA